MKIYMMVGLSGSGKSTIAKKISEEKNIPYLNADKIFSLLHRDKWTFTKNKKIASISIINILKQRDTSIYEADFTTMKNRSAFTKIMREYDPNAEFVAVCADVPAIIADQRFLERENIDPDLYNVASGDFGTVEEITSEEGFSSVVKISNDTDLAAFLNTIPLNNENNEISLEEILFTIKMVIKRYGYK